MNESFSSEESDSGASCSLFLAEIVETEWLCEPFLFRIFGFDGEVGFDLWPPRDVPGPSFCGDNPGKTLDEDKDNLEHRLGGVVRVHAADGCRFLFGEDWATDGDFAVINFSHSDDDKIIFNCFSLDPFDAADADFSVRYDITQIFWKHKK